jgi:hypothetical protein
MQYGFDPSTVSASFEVYPKGDYEVKIGEPKPFARDNRDGKPTYGVRYPLTITSPGPQMNKRALYSCYMHTEGSQAFTKQFLMAAYGYKRTQPEEERFNRDFTGKDWLFDPENGSVGDVWKNAQGQRITISLDVQKTEDDKEQQQFTGFRPISAGDSTRSPENVAEAYA